MNSALKAISYSQSKVSKREENILFTLPKSGRLATIKRLVCRLRFSIEVANRVAQNTMLSFFPLTTYFFEAQSFNIQLILTKIWLLALEPESLPRGTHGTT